MDADKKAIPLSEFEKLKINIDDTLGDEASKEELAKLEADLKRLRKENTELTHRHEELTKQLPPSTEQATTAEATTTCTSPLADDETPDGKLLYTIEQMMTENDNLKQQNTRLQKHVDKLAASDKTGGKLTMAGHATKFAAEPNNKGDETKNVASTSPQANH